MVSIKNIKNDCLDISGAVYDEWQSIVDLTARIAGVRAALIMKAKDDEIEVFAASRPRHHPYRPGDKNSLIGSGLYCERVIATRKMLFVPDASKSDEWRNNPDMKYNMKCYLGFPIRLPDGGVFGTLCILDDKENDFSQNIQDLMEKMRDLIESYLKLLHLSITDQLTGLYNRNYLARIAAEVASPAPQKKAMSALLLDIDYFKKINDTFGHLAGDKVLKNFSRILSSSLRDTDIAFRYGGDEFLVLLPDTAGGKAREEAERLRARIEQAAIWPGLPITTSIGVAERTPGEPPEHWFVRADRALYKIKDSGRNRTALAESGEEP